MTPRHDVPWEARAFRAWVRLLRTHLTATFEDDLVLLFGDRLQDVGASRGRRLLLLIRCAVDAIRHGSAGGVRGPGTVPPSATTTEKTLRRYCHAPNPTEVCRPAAGDPPLPGRARRPHRA